ncbi:MAG TPA: electron transfer flavoprotein-ubiquinone oxidoreductase [Candidatus Omnitrophota bacterium]|nr:electron transfer flavoprotein-ubiquinone oxidoreductase [Candidatus Omnitrophota bacterium]HPS37640.1 electron transfer flavoprotein-ubiquinone oxidoreductase [Candidatus Omnitrophota bacterium]
MAKNEAVETDILVVGGGVAGLAFAIRLADLAATEGQSPKILLLEKGSSLGSHNLSGAVVDPSTLKALLPDIPEKDLPFESPVTKDEFYRLTAKGAIKMPFTPPFMANKGNFVTSLGRLVRFLGEVAEKKGVQVYPGFSVDEILYENDKVIGAKTIDTGVDKHGKPMDNYQSGTRVHAKITILAEGSRGSLSTEFIRKHELQGFNPQVYSTGVKELWDVPEGTFEAGRVIHTLGYPFAFNHFGGGFVYGMSSRQVAVGIAAALDYKDPTFDAHAALQLYKKHPMVAKILEKGRILKYGAKTIPEGGLFSLPKLVRDGVMIVGDSAGFLSMPSLKGVHLAIESGMLAAQAAFEALKKNDTSAKSLSLYEELFRKSAGYKNLNRVRNFRAGFGYGMIFGAFHFATQILTGGRGITPSGKMRLHEDAACYTKLSDVKDPFPKKFAKELAFDKKLTFDKVTDVFYSGSKHDEEQPCHCHVLDIKLCRDICIPKYGGPCQHFCPAEVYEIVTDPKTGKKDLHLHPANCVHCKTCDIKDPFGNIRWVTPYGGDGPEYENM